MLSGFCCWRILSLTFSCQILKSFLDIDLHLALEVKCTKFQEDRNKSVDLFFIHVDLHLFLISKLAVKERLFISFFLMKRIGRRWVSNIMQKIEDKKQEAARIQQKTDKKKTKGVLYSIVFYHFVFCLLLSSVFI